MAENSLNKVQTTNYPQNMNLSPNAVSINIYSPQAFSNPQGSQRANGAQGTMASFYQPNVSNMPIYPYNYNNPSLMPNNMANHQTNPIDYSMEAARQANGVEKTPQNEETSKEEENKAEKKEEKQITPLTDEYIKTLENYLNNSNPKIRLIGAKELLERFKEDENRKDNKSLIPLLNKVLQDETSTVRFIGLTILQTGYSVGDDRTVEILKNIQNKKSDPSGEDQLLASEILLKMSAAQKVQRS